MKKLITLVLVLVLAFGLSIPALAFTSDTSEEEDHPYDLKIYLVEYEDNDLFGFATLPPSDRGYAKNEIVAAVVELVVPEDETMTNADFNWLELGGENVDLDVTDNYDSSGHISLLTSNVVEDTNADTYPTLYGDSIWVEVLTFPEDTTYKWLFFAKVTDDDASLFAELADGYGNGGEFAGEPSDYHMYVTLDGIYYKITKTDIGFGDFKYIIDITEGDYAGAQIIIDVDDDNVSLGMSIDPATTPDVPECALGVNTKNELGVIDPSNPSKFLSSDDAEDYMDIYEDIVVDVFKLDYFKIGNYVRDSYFEDLVSADTLRATVDIAPWTAYVTVPDNIVVDPPKTGDAASIMGFVMVALSCAGTAMLKKRS